MYKIPLFAFLLLISAFSYAQSVAHIDKKSKEFYFVAKPNTVYKIIGYQFANITTQKMICFSSYESDVRGNAMRCPLGAYFDGSI